MAAGLSLIAPPVDAAELALYVVAGAALYAVGAIAFGVLDARTRALAAARACLRRFRPAVTGAP
jgi:hypothetical protein